MHSINRVKTEPERFFFHSTEVEEVKSVLYELFYAVYYSFSIKFVIFANFPNFLGPFEMNVQRPQ